MAKRKAERADEVTMKARADELLAEIRSLEIDKSFVERDYVEAVERLAAVRTERMSSVLENLADAEQELLRMMRTGRDAFFASGDVCALTYGALLHAVESKVVIHGKKGEVIALAEAAGFTDAVKVEKSLDRDRIEKWPDDRLAVIGAERKRKDVFSYDLKKKEGNRG